MQALAAWLGTGGAREVIAGLGGYETGETRAGDLGGVNSIDVGLTRSYTVFINPISEVSL